MRVAITLSEVVAAWRLVHDAYVDKGIIDANPFGLHTNIQAACAGALVICSDTTGELTSTLTITRDGQLGLPLDDVYQTELEALRTRGARLRELGLFTHRLGPVPLRMLTASLGHALSDASSTVVIGVHPRHVGFYRRMFGFAPLSEARHYPALNGVPVCLLHLERSSLVVHEPPLVPLVGVDQAYDFAPSTLGGTVLARYLDGRRVHGVQFTNPFNHPEKLVSP